MSELKWMWISTAAIIAAVACAGAVSDWCKHQEAIHRIDHGCQEVK